MCRLLKSNRLTIAGWSLQIRYIVSGVQILPEKAQRPPFSRSSSGLTTVGGAFSFPVVSHGTNNPPTYGFDIAGLPKPNHCTNGDVILSGRTNVTNEPWFRLASALAIGLLIGAERERHKGEGPLRSAAGIRTFALASLLGGMSYLLGHELLLGVAILVIGAFCYAAYQRNQEEDPGCVFQRCRSLIPI